ncbi:MAG: hypothetical protein QNJ85_20265 [Gammaproteobacteria bacterium]|nr:hypothetical protein [Gammaproteobacteria bacterium]
MQIDTVAKNRNFLRLQQALGATIMTAQSLAQNSTNGDRGQDDRFIHDTGAAACTCGPARDTAD